MSVCDASGCTRTATVSSPSGRSVYCAACGRCAGCGGSVAAFVPHPDALRIYVCPCVATVIVARIRSDERRTMTQGALV